MLIIICFQITWLSVDETEQAIKTWGVIYQWLNYFMAAILAVILYFSKHPGTMIFLIATCPRTDSTLKCLPCTLYKKHILHKFWSFKKAPHFGSHLGNHLVLINFNDVSLVPFRIFNSKVYLKRINIAKLLVYKIIYFIKDRSQIKTHYGGH